MAAELPSLEELPRENTFDLKNNWDAVVRLACQSGAVAVVNGENVELVLMDPTTYQEITGARRLRASLDKTLLDELSMRFEERLAALQKPGARQKLDELLEAKGQSSSKPIAGEN